MRILAVIPARGGSKGVPRKNLYPLGGKPLIARTIDSALECPLLTDVAVSSDDDEILDVARRLGVSWLVRRPESLASDSAQSAPVVTHALNEMESRTQTSYDWVLMLQPTSPFRTAAHVAKAIELSNFEGADSVVSVVSVGASHPLRMKVNADGWMENYVQQPGWNMRPRQELPPVYIRNGAIYLIKADRLIADQALIGRRCRIFIMEEQESLNIDTEADIKAAQLILDEAASA